MHYYSFNIGDYTSHTAHLTPIEDIAYRRLLDLYYQTETPIPDDIKAVCRHIRMREHEDDVQQVLSEFFTLGEQGWTSARCDREISDYKSKADKARANGKLGGRPKKQKESENNQDGFSSFHLANQEQTESKANQEPRNNNQEPSLNKYSADKPQAPAKADRSSVDKPEGVQDQTWADFKKLRSAKRAPLTQTAMAKIAKQASLAGYTLEQALQTCCERGWQGFDASWVIGKPMQSRGPKPEDFSTKDYGEGIQLL